MSRSSVVVLVEDLAVDGRVVARAGARLVGGEGWALFNGRTVDARTMTVHDEAVEIERKATAREEEYQEAKP